MPNFRRTAEGINIHALPGVVKCNSLPFFFAVVVMTLHPNNADCAENHWLQTGQGIVRFFGASNAVGSWHLLCLLEQQYQLTLIVIFSLNRLLMYYGSCVFALVLCCPTFFLHGNIDTRPMLLLIIESLEEPSGCVFVLFILLCYQQGLTFYLEESSFITFL